MLYITLVPVHMFVDVIQQTNTVFPDPSFEHDSVEDDRISFPEHRNSASHGPLSLC